jgi:hypothetical protein
LRTAETSLIISDAAIEKVFSNIHTAFLNKEIKKQIPLFIRTNQINLQQNLIKVLNSTHDQTNKIKIENI